MRCSRPICAEHDRLSLLDGAPEVYMVDVMTGTARQAG